MCARPVFRPQSHRGTWRCRAEILLQHLHDGELHVIRREGLAIVKLDVLAQLEGDRLAIGGNLEASAREGFGLRSNPYSSSPSKTLAVTWPIGADVEM